MLYRIVSPDLTTQQILEVPASVSPFRIRWTMAAMLQVGQVRAVKQLGQAWIRIIPGVDRLTGKPATVGVEIHPEDAKFLDQVEELTPQSDLNPEVWRAR